MYPSEVVLEALGVICNATVTSVQTQRAAGGAAALRAAAPALCVAEALQPFVRLFLKQLISAVVDGDQTWRGTAARDSTVQAASTRSRCVLIDEDEFFDPVYDYDFTGHKDTETYYRGDEEYRRPCGWQRFALKVLDKYDGNEWLGTTARSTQSVKGEWPVSYHGTSHLGAEGIIKEYYKPGGGDAYGTGIYSTPDIKVAERQYSKEFTATKNGKRYKVILQNRINPKYRKICDRKDYWLVEIDPKLPEKEKKRLAERAIRPYGLLLKEA